MLYITAGVRHRPMAALPDPQAGHVRSRGVRTSVQDQGHANWLALPHGHAVSSHAGDTELRDFGPTSL